jgi:cation-transporting ATPase E
MRNIYGIINAMSIFIFVIVAVVIATMAYKIYRWGGDSSVFITEATKQFLQINYGEVVPSSIGLTDFYSWSVIITTASAFAIGVLPMGLVLLTSVTLAVSVISLAKQKTLIQELYSLENLSRIDTICPDKTGTLTDGSMTVKDIIFTSDSYEKDKDSLFRRLGSFIGAIPSLNATSSALAATFQTNKEFPVKEVIPFSSTRKMSEVIFKDELSLLRSSGIYPSGKR